MKFRRVLSRVCVIIAISLLANMLPPISGVHADPDPETTVVNEAEIPTGVNGVDFVARAAGLYDTLSGEESIFSDFDKSSSEDYLINAIGLNFIKADELSSYNHPVSRQTAMNILYKAVIAFDRSFELDEAEADYILNSCYDNAELYPESRIAYAFMIKHGIITELNDTNPSAELTADEVDKLFSDVFYAFNKNIFIYINNTKICAGDSEKSLIDKLGKPDRVDPSEYGFSWYVYNSDYAEYISVGINGGKVCAFSTNAKAFNFGDMKPGTDMSKTEVYADVNGLSFTSDNKNRLCSVTYNPYLALDTLTLEEYDLVNTAKALSLIDIINADRVKNGLEALSLCGELEAEHTFEATGGNIYELHRSLLDSGLSQYTDYEDGNAVLPSVTVLDGEPVFTLKTADMSKDITPVKPKSGYTVIDYSVERPEQASKPEISGPSADDVKENGSDVEIKLDKQVSDKYLVEIYDYEKNTNIVAQIVTTDSDTITYPAELFTGGSEYTVKLYAYDHEYKELSDEDKKDRSEYIESNEISFAYGTAETPAKLITPFNDAYTYDDELEITIDSSVYHDFRIDVYDASENIVHSQKLTGESFVNLPSIAPGTYTVKATALKRATDIECGSNSITCTIKDYTPEIKEFIIKPDEEFTYIYYTPDMEFLYLYEEETITKPVTSKQTIEEEYEYEVEYTENTEVEYDEEVTVEYVDENGVTQTKTEIVKKTKTEPVTRTRTETGTREREVDTTKDEVYRKIIQKKVPATKKNLREADLSGLPYSLSTSGNTPTEFGNAYAKLALSFQGVNYVWGGTTPNGFDCSGLVTYVAAQLGIKTHRVAEDQYEHDGVFVNRSDLIPGDLVFFADSTGYIHHVGIYIGNDMMVHAPHTGDVVRVASLNSAYYQREYAGAKRLSAE